MQFQLDNNRTVPFLSVATKAKSESRSFLRKSRNRRFLAVATTSYIRTTEGENSRGKSVENFAQSAQSRRCNCVLCMRSFPIHFSVSSKRDVCFRIVNTAG